MNIRNAGQYIQAFLKIKTKKNHIVPFVLNEPQRKLYDVIRELSKQDKPIRIIILKARQMGFSTLIEGLIFHRTATKSNVNSIIIAHKEESTSNLFNMSKLFFECLPSAVRPMRRASNAKELIFENPTKNVKNKQENPGLRSKIKCATAGGDGVGRSDTLTNVHASEYAFWTGDKNETLSGLLSAVPPMSNTFVAIESTANGFDHFKTLWDAAVAGENDFTPVFFAWFEMEEYQRPYDGFALTTEEEQIKAAHQLTNEQIAWRRWCIANNCGGDLDLFKQEYPATPEEAFISTGACVFSKTAIIARLEQVKKHPPQKTGYFLYSTYYDSASNSVLINDSSITWRDDNGSDGCISIYQEATDGVPYVIGGDTAGDGSDCFVGQAINNITGEQVAILRHAMDEDLYAMQMYCLGRYYNGALIAIESNYTMAPLKTLHRLQYPRQYYRESMDSVTNKMQYKYGYRTDKITRPLMLAELVTLVRDNVELISDATTLREMLTFIRNESGRPEAMSGEHDDCVMALAIAHSARGQQAYCITTVNPDNSAGDYDISGFVEYS